MCKSDTHTQISNINALEATSVSFHYPTLMQSVLASIAILVFAIMLYYTLRYLGYCRPRPPTPRSNLIPIGHDFEPRQRGYATPPAYAPAYAPPLAPPLAYAPSTIQPEATGLVGTRKEFN